MGHNIESEDTMSKYNACKTMVFGQLFDSKAEASRYLQLRALEKAGEIEGLHTQVSFELIPKLDGQRACYFIADFVYNKDGKTIVEDVKSIATKTQAYMIKKKLMLWRHNIRITEVMT